MPNIKEAPIGNIQLAPTDRGVDAATQAARRIGVFYSQEAEDDRRASQETAKTVDSFADAAKAGIGYLDHEQISKGMADEANLRLSLTKSWDDTLAHSDPNDPSVGSKFRDAIQPKLQDWADSFYTEKSQNWAQERAGDLLNHFYQKTVSDQSTMAMVAARNNLRTMANQNSTTVALDPASLPAVLKSMDDNLGHFVNSSPTLTAEHRAQITDDVGEKMKENVVKSAITSAIIKNPDAGLAMSQNPDYAKYLNGGEVNAFYKEAVRAQKADATNSRLDQERELKDTSEKTTDTLVQGLYDPDPTKRPTMQQILQIPGSQITPAARKQALDIAEKRQENVPEAEAKKNAVDLITAVHNGTVTSLDQINKALGDGKLDYPRYQEVKKEFDEARTPDGQTISQARGDFLKNYGPIVNPLNPATGMRDEDGYRRAYQLQQYAKIKEGELRAAGKDPSTVYDPRSPDFIGNSQYARPKSPADLLQSAKSGAAPAKPAGAPEAGAVVKGYRFKGGDPHDEKNWEKQ